MTMTEQTTTNVAAAESPPVDAAAQQMQNMRVASDDEGNEQNSSPPQQYATGPIKVDIRPEDPNETPYEVITNRVFVGGFPLNTSEEEVRKIFGQWGEIIDVKIIRKEVEGQTKGYGFVTYKNDDDAEIVRGKENVKINGKKLNLGPAMRRLYSTLREVKEARAREQLLSDGTDSPSTTNGTPPTINAPHNGGRRANGGNGHYPSRRYYNKRNRTYNNERRNNHHHHRYEELDAHGLPKPIPLLSLDMTPMYIAPFDLNKAINSSSNEFQFLQCTVPMSDHTLPAAIRQQFDAQFDVNHYNDHRY